MSETMSETLSEKLTATGAIAASDATAGHARQAVVVAALAGVLPRHAILSRHEDTVPYECDGLTAYRESPLVVVLPGSEEQVAAVLRTCHALQVPVVARGAGTGLSGGALSHRLGAACAAGHLRVRLAGARAAVRRAAPAAELFAAADRLGGHATLFRSTDTSGAAFAPLAAPQVRMHRELKQAFDPAGIFNKGRMVPEL